MNKGHKENHIKPFETIEKEGVIMVGMEKNCTSLKFS
jgi:hypothetical protein